MRVSELASKSTTLSKEVKSLKEQLEVKTSKINDLQAKIKTHTSLTESVNANETKVKTLTERLVAVQTAAEKSEEELRSKLEESRKAVQQNATVAKKYKAQYTAVLEHYIASKASMLGVRPTDITSRLGESYTLDNIDKVCEDLLDMPQDEARLDGLCMEDEVLPLYRMLAQKLHLLPGQIQGRRRGSPR